MTRTPIANRVQQAAAAIALAVIVGLTIWVLAAGNPYDDEFDNFRSSRAGNAQTVGDAPDSGPQLERFLAFVVDDVQGYGAREFESAGRQYVPAEVLAFEGGAVSPCGPASAQTVPFYCLLDHRI